MTGIFNAVESDRADIALIIAESYSDDFAPISKNPQIIASAIASGFLIDKFYVYKENGIIAGIAALSDINSRAVYLKNKDLRKYLGFIKGTLLRMFTKKEFEGKAIDSAHKGLIEFVAVPPRYRGNGISGKIISHIIKNCSFNEYILDVKDTNTAAIKVYEKLGFYVFKREKVPKSYGFNEKLFMKFEKKEKIF